MSLSLWICTLGISGGNPQSSWPVRRVQPAPTPKQRGKPNLDSLCSNTLLRVGTQVCMAHSLMMHSHLSHRSASPDRDEYCTSEPFLQAHQPRAKSNSRPFLSNECMASGLCLNTGALMVLLWLPRPVRCLHNHNP